MSRLHAMIRYFIFSILTLFLVACTTPSANVTKSESLDTAQIVTDTLPQILAIDPTQGNNEDTIFLLKTRTKDLYHAIYIEKNRESKYYKWLTNFSLEGYDKEALEANFEAIKEKYTGKAKKFKHPDLPSEWLPLYPYKGKFYLYAPSDWGNAGRRIITDSTLVYWYMDGPYPELLLDLKKTNSTYSLTSLNPFSEGEGKAKVIIHILDKKNKLALWEFEIEDENYRYRLYIPKENAGEFDMVVNYCKDMKQMEFDFDKIDHKKLLDKK